MNHNDDERESGKKRRKKKKNLDMGCTVCRISPCFHLKFCK